MKKIFLLLGIVVLSASLFASGYTYYGSYLPEKTKFITIRHTEEYYVSPTETYYSYTSNLPSPVIYREEFGGDFWNPYPYYWLEYYPYYWWNPYFYHYPAPLRDGWGFGFWYFN